MAFLRCLERKCGGKNVLLYKQLCLGFFESLEIGFKKGGNVISP